jgi:hypothetical protein
MTNKLAAKVCEELTKANNIISMVRNFDCHVGGYDADLPEKEYPSSYEAQTAFRGGWFCAVDAINKEIDKMQE